MDYKSKTQKKKEALALQKLGEKLVKLSAEQLDDIDMPEDIYNAVREAKAITSRGARRRQMQYIGTLMRKVDPAFIELAMKKV
jgi:ribosome-associated protein